MPLPEPVLALPVTVVYTHSIGVGMNQTAGADMTQDVRWVLRFANYLKAFDELKEGVQLGGTRELSKLEKQGIIQRVGRVIYRAGRKTGSN